MCIALDRDLSFQDCGRHLHRVDRVDVHLHPLLLAGEPVEIAALDRDPLLLEGVPVVELLRVPVSKLARPLRF
jgi:hypothetical protein